MPDYETVREDRIATGATATISGVPVEGVERRIGDRNFVLISTCVCVTAEGCPCNGPLVWLPEDDILKSESSGDRSKDGENIHHYRLAPTSQVVIESYTSLPARKASRMLEADKLAEASIREFGTEMAGVRRTARTGYGTGTNATPPGTAALIGAGIGPGPAGAVTGAFMAGFTVGKYIEEKTDASDVISDILIDLFG